MAAIRHLANGVAAWIVVASLGGVVTARADLRFERLGTDDGLSQAYVISMVQDARGFLWFGTGNGLNRWDGGKFRVFQHDSEDPTSLSSDVINALAADARGDLWIGTLGGGLCRYRHRIESFACYRHDPERPDSLASDAIWAVFVDREGGVWVGTLDEGVSYLSPAATEAEEPSFVQYRAGPAPDGLAGDGVLAFEEDVRGRLWIGTRDGLSRLDRATGLIDTYRHDPADPSSLSGDVVRVVFEDAGGTVWVGTEHAGLDRWVPESDTFVRYRHDPDDPRSISEPYVRAIAQDGLGQLWVATMNEGLDRLDPETGLVDRFRHDPTDPNSLAADAIMSLLVDRGGLLWIGGRGLSSHDPLTELVRGYRHRPGDPTSLGDDRVMSIHRDDDGTLWIGTEFGGLSRLDPVTDRFETFRPDPEDPSSLPDDKVLALTRDAGGTLWVGTDSAGLLRAIEDGSRVTLEVVVDGETTQGSVVGLLEDRQGAFWISTFGGGLLRLDRGDGTVDRFLLPGGVTRDAGTLTRLIEDGDGRLWVGTWGRGLALFDRQRHEFRLFRNDPEDPSSLNSDYVTAVAESDAGTLWIGTGQRGFAELTYLDETTATFRRVGEHDGLSNEDIYSLVPDDLGRLWVATNQGLDRYDPRNGEVVVFTAADGLQGSEFNEGAGYRDREGTLYFGGPNGLDVFRPEDLRPEETPPPVVITELLLFNRPVRPRPGGRLEQSVSTLDELSLTYRDVMFTFELAALDFRQPERCRYRYRLEGFDEQWIEAGQGDRKAVFTSIPPGRYTFRAMAANKDGVWNERGVALSVVVSPPWWRTWWAETLAGLLVLGTAVSWPLARLARERRRAAELEAKVEERTAELARAARTDPLTGLSNRRHFQERAEDELTAYRRTGRAFSVALADVDHFKSINDLHGHEAGDQVLTELARLLRDGLRRRDVLARWGGEEFVVLLPETGPEGARAVAEKLRREVAGHHFVWQDEPISVTLTVGLSGIGPDMSLESCIAAADAALYAGKAGGRNCVVVAGPENPSTSL